MGDLIDFDLLKSLKDVENSEKVKRRLIITSLYVTCYEALKDSIVDQVRKFYIPYNNPAKVSNSDEDKKEYEKDVLRLDKYLFHASILWLKKMGAVNAEDEERINKFRDLRNKIVHNLSDVIFYWQKIISEKEIIELRNLINKIDVWFIKNLELSIHNAVTGDDIDIENSHPISGTVMILDMIIKAGLVG